MSKLAIFTKNVYKKNECLINQKIFIRSAPAITSNRCYKLAFCPPTLQTIVNTTFHCLFRVRLCDWIFFIFRRGGDFFNSILAGWERWKLFCKLWPVLGLVQLANVLTTVLWISFVILVHHLNGLLQLQLFLSLQ